MPSCETPEECEVLGENAAVASMIFTIIGWLLYRLMAAGELGNAREKMIVSGIILLLIVYNVNYEAQPGERP